MSGPSGHWSADEDDKLHELPWGAQLLYLRGLRRFVHTDGVVGVVRRISYRGLIETLTVPECRGRHAKAEEAPTQSMIRHLLAVLVKSGLIVVHPTNPGGLVFRLPYALQDKSVPRMSSTINSTMSDTMSSTVSDRQKPHGNAGLHGVDEAMSNTMNNAMSNAMSSTQQSKAVIGNYSVACRSPKRAREENEIGELCKRLRQEAHMLDANPHRSELIALLTDGFSIALIVETAIDLASKPKGVPNVGYLTGTVRGRFHDSQHTEVGHAVSGGRRESVCEANERQSREFDERERRGPHLHVVN